MNLQNEILLQCLSKFRRHRSLCISFAYSFLQKNLFIYCHGSLSLSPTLLFLLFSLRLFLATRKVIFDYFWQHVKLKIFYEKENIFICLVVFQEIRQKSISGVWFSNLKHFLKTMSKITYNRIIIFNGSLIIFNF